MVIKKKTKQAYLSKVKRISFKEKNNYNTYVTVYKYGIGDILFVTLRNLKKFGGLEIFRKGYYYEVSYVKGKGHNRSHYEFFKDADIAARKKAYSLGKKFLDIQKPKVIYSKKRQVGKSNLIIDKKYKAMLPGKRVSKFGNTYYEYRKNRTDLK